MASSPPRNPQTSLADLKRRLNQAQEVVVSADGTLHHPDDPRVAAESTGQKKTVLKPQRWF